jgi:hypothetical protein
MIDNDKIIVRFLEACVTGENLPHRVSLRALGHAMRERDPLREVVKLDKVHPAAQSKFLEQWTKVAVWQSIREGVADDELWFAALRKLLPPYDGPPMQLYRGQRINEALGMSWTRSYLIARDKAGQDMGGQTKRRTSDVRRDAIRNSLRTLSARAHGGRVHRRSSQRLSHRHQIKPTGGRRLGANGFFTRRCPRPRQAVEPRPLRPDI